VDITVLEVFANAIRLRSLLADGAMMPMMNVYQRKERRVSLPVMTSAFESFVIIAGLKEVPGLRTCAFITSLQFIVKVAGFIVKFTASSSSSKSRGLQFVVKIPKLQLIEVTGFQMIDKVGSTEQRLGFSAE
jgi:hypothetical protein